MFFRKLNNQELWDKIKQLRAIIRRTQDFKQRICWKCGKDLNIYDFLSDNIEYSAEQIFKLWQSSLLEFHCCDCFKSLKRGKLDQIANQKQFRRCNYCKSEVDIYDYAKIHNYLKIHELRSMWLNPKSEIFCDSICRRKFNRELHKSSINLES
jgi:NAD-dependent SIR2 family protein deacetylase